MSWKLENLPFELFGALSELLLANEVCWLWLSGSKRIQHLLENGGTNFHHLPAQRRAYLWPSFISHFKRLQTVSIASAMPYNTSQLYHSIVLGDIPKSVTSLKLYFANALLSLLQPPSIDIVSSDISLQTMPLSAMFQNLTHLEVYDAIGGSQSGKTTIHDWNPILALPLSTLRLLPSIPFPTALLKHLPPTITILKLSPLKGEVDSFPPHLTDLSLELFVGSLDSSVLPKTLRSLTLNCMHYASFQCHNWPFELEILSITHFGLQLSHSDIAALPNTLLSLSIIVSALEFLSLHNLPQKLTYFFFNDSSLSAVSEEQWTHFEPKHLPPNLEIAPMDFFILHTPHERFNTFPKGIQPTLDASVTKLEDIVPTLSVMADHVDRLDWNCSEPEINWSFKKISTLNFGESVHPGQVYLILPLLPLLRQLSLSRYIEDPSLALNRITSPFISRLVTNCHPLSLCKWDKQWLQCVDFISLNYHPVRYTESELFDMLASSGHELDDNSRNEILAMDNTEWHDWTQFGGTLTDKQGIFLNWRLYAYVLPRTLAEFEISGCQPMGDIPHSISGPECAWPPRLKRIDAFIPPCLWSSLPQGLEALNTWLKDSDLVQLAKDLKTTPKMLNSIFIKFVDPTAVSAETDLHYFTKLLQERIHLDPLVIEDTVMRLPNLRQRHVLPVAIEATFGLRQSE